MTNSPTDHEGLIASIRQLELLALFSDRQLEAIASIVERVDFSPDQIIFEEQSEGTDFLVVGEGRVEARRQTPVGDQAVATLDRGQICGEISMLDGHARSATVVAVSPGYVLQFKATGMADLVAEHPEIEIGLLGIFCRSLAAKIRQANQVMTQIMASDTPDARVAMGKRGEHRAMDEETKKKILSAHGMSSDDLQLLTTHLEAETFSSGDSIFVEGEPGDTLYIVADGKVRISRHFPGMGEEALAILDRGEVFGEMAWIDASPRSADAVAHTGGCTVLGISRQHLDGTLHASTTTHRQFLRILCQILCRRVRNMNDQLVAYRTMAFF